MHCVCGKWMYRLSPDPPNAPILCCSSVRHRCLNHAVRHQQSSKDIGQISLRGSFIALPPQKQMQSELEQAHGSRMEADCCHCHAGDETRRVAHDHDHVLCTRPVMPSATRVPLFPKIKSCMHTVPKHSTYIVIRDKITPLHPSLYPCRRVARHATGPVHATATRFIKSLARVNGRILQ